MSERSFEQQMERFPVGSAYVPWQRFERMFENLEEAFRVGTIFPELDKPFEGRRFIK